ncbi:MAG: hypothetical protein OER87_18535, partial [Gammaproteobacteria bacterium]|nr:hypothetical protein [Gammaproteobacteria bacterium]
MTYRYRLLAGRRKPAASARIAVRTRHRGSMLAPGLACLLLAAANPSLAQECSHHDQSLEGLPITSITIENENIFDPEVPEQNLWIHRMLNLLHIPTRKETIEGMLLVNPEDTYLEKVIQENERLLRAQDYLHDAEIKPEVVCGEGVRLRVVSTDNWTLTGGLSANSTGGETRTAFKIEEANLLGRGIGVKLERDTDEDREQNILSFRDSDWFGNRKRLELALGDNSDGHLYNLDLSRPFVQLDSTNAWSITLSSRVYETPVYDAGVIVDKVGQDTALFQFSYQWSEGLIDAAVTRWGLGWEMSETDYFATDDFPTSAVSKSEVTRFPFVTYTYLKENYLQLTNFRFMGVTEDLAIGDSLSLRLGWKDEAFGTTREGFVFGLNYGVGSSLGAQTFAFFDLGLGYESNSSVEGTGNFNLGGRMYHYRDPDHAYLVSATFEAARVSEPVDQYLLGGDTGVKGYPVRYQNGDRKVTLSFEKRDYFKWYPLQLFKLGTALFAETGSAWISGNDPNFISDVGIGLRVVSTRQSNSKVLHAAI